MSNTFYQSLKRFDYYMFAKNTQVTLPINWQRAIKHYAPPELKLNWWTFGDHIEEEVYLPRHKAGPRSAVGNVSGYRCVSDCRSRGREFDPGPVPYFRGDWSWNDFYGHSPPFRWFIQEGLLSVTSESMCTNYWFTPCSSLPRKKCG